MGELSEKHVALNQYLINISLYMYIVYMFNLPPRMPRGRAFASCAGDWDSTLGRDTPKLVTAPLPNARQW